MKSDLTTIEKLDLVLTEFATNSKTTMTNHFEWNQIVQKLERDGFVHTEKEVKNEGNNITIRHSLTLDGKLLYESGGYTQRNKNEEIKLREIELKNEKDEKNASELVRWTSVLTERTKSLFFWTKVLAVTTIGLVLLELVKWIVERMD